MRPGIWGYESHCDAHAGRGAARALARHAFPGLAAEDRRPGPDACRGRRALDARRGRLARADLRHPPVGVDDGAVDGLPAVARLCATRRALDAACAREPDVRRTLKLL